MSYVYPVTAKIIIINNNINNFYWLHFLWNWWSINWSAVGMIRAAISLFDRIDIDSKFLFGQETDLIFMNSIFEPLFGDAGRITVIKFDHRFSSVSKLLQVILPGNSTITSIYVHQMAGHKAVLRGTFPAWNRIHWVPSNSSRSLDLRWDYT